MALHLQTERAGIDMMIEDNEWITFREMNKDDFSRFLLKQAEKVNLSQFQKSKQSKKKRVEKIKKNDPYAGHPHISTARLLSGITP